MKKILAALALVTTFCGAAMKSDQKQMPTQLYKIVSMENWKKSKNKKNLVLSNADSKFIHFSKNKKLVEYVVNKYWKDEPYMLLTIDTKKTPGTYKLEYNSKKTDQFWHLYNGAIPHTAIEKKEIINP